ncbi:MAG: hypothetical protein FJ290_07025 [Planctomycetes bacterium]|nr:hypothetical protein [Planctomycetota bacterium]
MTPAAGQHAILPFRLATAPALLLAIALVAAWVMVHALRRRTTSRWRKGLLLAAGPAVGFLALLTAFDLMQRVAVLATNWAIWPIALGGALVVEAVLLLYALERRIVPRRTGVALAALRVAVALLIVVMLAQPVRSIDLSRTLQRFVAVLVDDSASMHVPDKQLTPAEKVRLAEVLSPGLPARPWRTEALVRKLREGREQLAAQVDWFASLREAKPEARQRLLEGRRKATAEALDALRAAAAEQLKLAAEPLQGKLPLDARTVTAISQLRDRLTSEVHDPIVQAAELLATSRLPMVAADPEPAIKLLRDAAEALGRQEPRAAALGDALDEAFYNSLAPEQRAKVDAVALKERFALVQDLLHRAAREPGPEAARRGLLGDLGASGYGLRLYAFAAKPAEVNLAEGLHETKPQPVKAPPDKGKKGSATGTSGGAADLPVEQQKTDIAGAIEKVMTEVPADRLAGIVLLTDGQHNAATPVEPLARSIGLRQVPVSSIVFGGGAKPTIDAAVVGLEAPETVYSKDKLYLNADLKLDGLAGKTVRVTLYDGETAVDTEEVRVEADKLRTRVQLADEPKEGGLHAYRVKVEDVEGEVLASNNERPLAVSVTDDQTRLLVIEGRPRWEFRYLKNLFASRDRTVKLQYVVLHPDEIPGQPPRRRVHASAARPKDEPEATALPENEAEWMKFDVIVLGDVEPDILREPQQKILKKFVEDRAGVLIVIAGPRHMPHAYASAPLADLLPVTFKAAETADDYVASPDERFHIELTPEGREHVITRLKVEPAENLETWASLPDLAWRHPITTTKEAALILAYALPPQAPDYMRAGASEGQKPEAEEQKAKGKGQKAKGGSQNADADAEKRQQYIREHALFVTHNAALGRVLFVATDHTWRLRYRVGDTHHHRFWGQVLRWATSDKLPAGTNLVKLGTDRPRYSPDQVVRVRAKITQPDFTPVESPDVAAVVYLADKPVLRRKMDYVKNSLGLYSADLGKLDGGTYRVELEAPAAKDLLASEGADKVSTEFFVEPAVPQEQIELAANRGLLERIATLTNGRVADPAHAADALAALGAATLTLPDRRQWAIWNSWPLLVLIVALAGIEWFIRKRARLA